MGTLSPRGWPGVRREQVQQRLGAAGIETGIHYPVPCHRQSLTAGPAGRPLPVAEQAAGEALSLPIFPHMRDDQVDRVCEAVQELWPGPSPMSPTCGSARAWRLMPGPPSAISPPDEPERPRRGTPGSAPAARLYVDSRIRERGFQTGHNVVVREDCEIGDDVSVGAIQLWTTGAASAPV